MDSVDFSDSDRGSGAPESNTLTRIRHALAVSLLFTAAGSTKEGDRVPRASCYIATAMVAFGMILGCTINKPTGLSSAKPASSMSFSSVTEGAKKTTSSITRAISSRFKKSAASLKPHPKVVTASDPIALSSGTPKSTPKLLVSMAVMQEQGGNFEQADELYHRALQLEKNHLGATLGLAHLQDRQGQLEKATLMYLQAAKLHPQASAVHNDLGLCYARRGMFDKSAASLRTATELEPEKKLFRNNLATVLIEQSRNDEALVHLTQAHGPAAAHYNLGYLLHQRGNDVQAVEHFAAALKADPTMTQAQTWLAQLQPQAPDSQLTQTQDPLPQVTVPSDGPQFEVPTGLPEVGSESEVPDGATPVVAEKMLSPQVPLQNPEVTRRSEEATDAPQPTPLPTYLQPQARADSRYAPAPSTPTSEASSHREESPSRYSGYYSSGENEIAPLPKVEATPDADPSY